MAQNYVLLENVTLNATASSIVFDNLPTSGYTDLKIVLSARTNSGGGQAAALQVRFNGDTGSNYTYKGLEAYSGSAKQSYGATTSYSIVGGISTDASASGTFGNLEFYIPNYRGSQYKTHIGEGWGEYNSAVLGAGGFYASYWNNTAAITSITLFVGGDFAAGTTCSLFGVAAKNVTPIVAPFATGGNTVLTDGTYWYHTFTSSGSFVPTKNISVDYLVVGGGAGSGGGSGNPSGSGAGGGGGARCTVGATGGGGSLESALLVSANTPYPVLVGAGGSRGGFAQAGYNGSNSTFASITALGGGGGGGARSGASAIRGANGFAGGTGGGGGAGGASGTGTGASGTSGQGYAGGNAYSTSAGGGGGGAGSNGSQGSSGSGGAGGAGIQTAISGTATYYGGGGGGGRQGGSGGAGGAGGGTNGTGNNSVVSASANTGGGSGGGGDDTTGGDGGSGIVIIRYAIA